MMFGSEGWVPATSLGACDQSVCLKEYQLPVELDTKICLSFISCSSSVQHWESLGLFGLIVHGPPCLPVYTGDQVLARIYYHAHITQICKLGQRQPHSAQM